MLPVLRRCAEAQGTWMGRGIIVAIIIGMSLWACDDPVLIVQGRTLRTRGNETETLTIHGRDLPWVCGFNFQLNCNARHWFIPSLRWFVPSSVAAICTAMGGWSILAAKWRRAQSLGLLSAFFSLAIATYGLVLSIHLPFPLFPEEMLRIQRFQWGISVPLWFMGQLLLVGSGWLGGGQPSKRQTTSTESTSI